MVMDGKAFQMSDAIRLRLKSAKTFCETRKTILKWSDLRSVGNSWAAKATILIPLLGYLVLLNANVVGWLKLIDALDQNVSDVSPRLLLIYLGLCSVAAGAVLYGIFCAAEVKYYGTAAAYVRGDGPAIKDFAFEEIEKVLRENAATAKEYIKIRNRYELSPSGSSRMIAEPEKVQVNNGMLHLYFKYQNEQRCWFWKWPVAVFYLVGFICLSIPSLGVFRRVFAMVFGIAKNNFSSFF